MRLALAGVSCALMLAAEDDRCRVSHSARWWCAGPRANGGVQVLARSETCGRQDVADATVEALDHTVGLWVTRFDQAMLDAVPRTFAIKGVVAGRLLALGGESIRELAAVVGQQFLDPHRCGCVHATQEVCAALFALVRVDTHVHPACGAVDGHG